MATRGVGISTQTITRTPVISARDAERALRTASYLERGVAQHPVQGITIAGNLTHLLSAVTGVGPDLTFGPSGGGSPTLVISELSSGGT